MRKLIISGILLISFWTLTVSEGDPVEWYVVFHEDENSIHKCGRDEYLEMRELFDNPVIDKELDFHLYYMWELDFQTPLLIFFEKEDKKRQKEYLKSTEQKKGVN